MGFSIEAFMRDAHRRAEYNRFMKSETWAAIRGAKLACSSHRCEQCGSTKRLEAHHLTYARFGGAERMSDLQILCERCHNKAHGRKF